MGSYKERIELGCYTKMSEMKGINSVSEYIEEAKLRNWKAIGITDLNSTQSFYEAQKYIMKNDIKDLKIIYEEKTKFIDDINNKTEIYNIVILVKQQSGLKNLYELLSKAFANNAEDGPVIFKSQLDKYRDGLIYGSYGINGELYKNLYQAQDIDFDKVIKYYDFIEIEPLYNTKEIIRLIHTTKKRIIDNTEKIKKINKKIIELGNKNNILIIATSNSLFIKKEDKICNEILNYSNGLRDIEYNNERYLHTTEEMLKEFNYLSEEEAYNIVINNTNKIANMCENIDLILNKANYPEIKNSKKIIKEKCYKKAYKIYGKNLPKEVQERLDTELNSIIKNNFEFIYLLAEDAVKKSEELGYLVFARGSVGNSFVAYLLGITDYNPIEYDLPFEIFAGKNFDKEPDIDLNFSEEIRDEIQKHIAKKYSKNKLIYCGTVGTIAEKTALNMVTKYCKKFNKIISEKRIEELTEKLCGIKRTTGIHPGGFFLLPEDKEITDFCPIDYDNGNKNRIKTHVDYHSIDYSGLYKFDMLSQGMPTILHNLEKSTGVNPKEIDLNDEKTLQLFLNTEEKGYNQHISGIPEFSTDFAIKVIKESNPKNLNDLICISCLCHGTGTWNDNAENLIKNKFTTIDKVISNRADIMNYLINKGLDRETSFDITEFIRKGNAAIPDYLGYKENIREKYIEQWEKYKKILKEHNIPEWYINSCENIYYLFPKAHAIGYTINSFRIAWYKAHYPEKFDDKKFINFSK